MQPIPLSTFRLRQPGYLGIEATTVDGRTRLLIVRADAGANEIEAPLLAEAAMAATIDAALRDRIDYRPQVGGVARKAGNGAVDFVLAGRSGDRRAGIHAMASIEGIDDLFLRRLTARDEGLESLTIITQSSSKPVAMPVLSQSTPARSTSGRGAIHGRHCGRGDRSIVGSARNGYDGTRHSDLSERDGT